MRLFAVLFALLAPLCAGEIAVLTNGSRLRADKVERDGDRIVLHTAGGRIEFDAAAISEIEVEAAPEVEATPVAVAPPAAPRTARELLTEAALRHGLPPEFVHSVASVESAYRVNAVSPKGAIGIMQLMPGTARSLNADPNIVEQNIDAGTRLLRDLLLRYQGGPEPVRRALAAYNAGEGAVMKYSGIPPYRETQAYVEKVIERYWKLVNAPKASR